MNIIRPKCNPIYLINNPHGLKLLTRLRLQLSHLREHKFKHNFQDTLNPLCDCSLNIESTEHFFLHCLNFDEERQDLFNNLNDIDRNLVLLPSSELVTILLYGKASFNNVSNFQILSSSISFILSTKRFDGNLL